MNAAQGDIAARRSVTQAPAAPTAVLAVAAGALIANLYYGQLLIADIAADLSVTRALAGSLIAALQLGYGLGLLLLVPLSDVIENRRLVLSAVAVATAALAAMTLARAPEAFLAAAMTLGFCCSAAQVLVPLVAHFVAPERRARAIGNLMATILVGVTLARPAALALAEAAGWRAVFAASGLLLAFVFALLAWGLPLRRPQGGIGYGSAIRSAPAILRRYPAVGRRALYQACLFFAFNMFWATAPLVLRQQFGLATAGVALFALAGAGGALAAWVAARHAVEGRTAVTVAAAVVAAAAFIASPAAITTASLAAFAAIAVLIDGAVQVGQATGRLVTLSVDPDERGRANSLYMTVLFVGGGSGSLLGTLTYDIGGWTLTAFFAAGACTTVALFAWRDGLPRARPL